MVKQQLLYRYPPDIQKAQKHRLANRIFKGIQKDPMCPQCECCDRKIGVEIVQNSCCYDYSDLAFLGPGVPLFFAYVKNCILLLLTFTVIFTAYCIYSNISQNYCDSSGTNCQYSMFNTISFANKMSNSDLLSIQNYVVLTFVIVNIVLFHYFRWNSREIQQKCDDIVNSPSDYAIILRRLPEQITKEDLQMMVDKKRGDLTPQQRIKTDNLKIDHIVLSYYMGEYTRVKNQNLEKFKQLLDDDKMAEFKPQPVPPLNETAKIAIIVFSRQQSKQFFLYKPDILQKFIHLLCDPCTPLSNFEVKGQRISIERAPEPDDVVWQNSKISISGAIIRKTIFNILGALLLFLGGLAQYYLAVLQHSITDDTKKQLLSIGLSVLIAIFNFIILQFLVFTSAKERNQTLTEFNTVLTVKITFFQFLNTGIFVILANFLADIQGFTITQSLPSDITIVMLMNAITPNLSLWVLNYFQIIGKIMRWLVKNGKMKVSQMEANKLWQGPEAQIPYKYGYVLKTLWLTAFYAPLVPIVVPISIGGLLLNYFIEKDLYRKIYNVPNMLSSMVNDSGIELMEYFPLILSMGQWIIYVYVSNYDVASIPQNWSIPIYISIALSALNVVLPMDQVNRKIFKLNHDDDTGPPYDKIEGKFQVTYQMTNPAYECKKKRKRDVFLFNHIFGGETKNVAADMSGFLGLDQTKRGLLKDPLMNKSSNSPINEILGNLKGSKSPKNGTQVVEPVATKKEQNNPFGALLKKNANQTKQENNQNNNTSENKYNPQPQPAKNSINSPFSKSQKIQTNQNIFNPTNGNQNFRNSYPTNQNEPAHFGPNPTKNSNVLQKNPSNVANEENKPIDYKSITKDLKYKYNNNLGNKNQPTPVQYVNPLSEMSSDEKHNKGDFQFEKGLRKQTDPSKMKSQHSSPKRVKNERSFIQLLSEVKQKQMNPYFRGAQNQVNKNNEVPSPTANKNKKDTFEPTSPSRRRNNPNKQYEQQTQEMVNFRNQFPNLEEQRKITKQTRQKFIEESPQQIDYSNSRFTKSGTVFVQNPEPQSRNKFPHVQIHVPGMKPEDYRKSKLNKSQNKSPTNNNQFDDNFQMMDLKGSKFAKNNQFKTEEIYNPRFSNKQPIDMNKMYGPPKGYGRNQ